MKLSRKVPTALTLQPSQGLRLSLADRVALVVPQAMRGFVGEL